MNTIQHLNYLIKTSFSLALSTQRLNKVFNVSVSENCGIAMAAPLLLRTALYLRKLLLF